MLLAFCPNKAYFKFSSELKSNKINLESKLKLLSFKLYIEISIVYFKYTLESENNYINLENLLHLLLSLEKYINLESRLQVYIYTVLLNKKMDDKSDILLVFDNFNFISLFISLF